MVFDREAVTNTADPSRDKIYPVLVLVTMAEVGKRWGTGDFRGDFTQEPAPGFARRVLVRKAIMLLVRLGFQVKRQGVDAVAQAGFIGRTILEHMPQVRPAAAAHHFGPHHAELGVFM